MRLLDRLLGRSVPVWHHPDYRPPMSWLEGRIGLDPRRADLVAWYLAEHKVIRRRHLRRPQPIRFADAARVHTAAYLERLGRPETLAHIFAASPAEIRVDVALGTIRLGCGGTLAAAREALVRRGPALNLLGGFHHAAPNHGAGGCALNDIAIAVAVLRDEDFRDPIAILDLDAHPPDGTAACLANDANTWIGSLSGSDWGPIPDVDETVLPERAPDAVYLEQLRALLRRMPASRLVFVLAGGDVLHGDRLGLLGLSLGGVRQRDHLVAEALHGTASVWVPGGGYHRDSWRVLAGSALVLTGREDWTIPTDADPMSRHFARIAVSLGHEELGDGDLLTEDDLAEAFGAPTPGPRRLLGFYTASGIEYALFRFGLLGHLSRLGYDPIRVEVGRATDGDRFRVLGMADGAEHMLVECVLSREVIDGQPALFCNWLMLRNPRIAVDRPEEMLPGQDAPGLGMAREAGELLALMARRLNLSSVVIRPAWYHVAYVSRYEFHFVDPAVQGRFEAMQRDLRRPLPLVTRAIAEGRVRMNGEPYEWEAEYMMFPFGRPRDEAWRQAVDLEKARVRFDLVQAGGRPRA